MSEEREIIVAKRVMPPQYYMHLSFLVMATVIIAMSFLMRVVGTNLVYLPGSSLPLPESCTARIFFGFDCPACGMTRAFISISHGQFGNAWTFNPASFAAYLFTLVQIPWQSFQLWRIRRGQPSFESIWLFVLPISMVLIMLLQWIYRIAT